MPSKTKVKKGEEITAESLCLPEGVEIAGEPIGVYPVGDLFFSLEEKGFDTKRDNPFSSVVYREARGKVPTLTADAEMLLGTVGIRKEGGLGKTSWRMVGHPLELVKGFESLLVIGDGRGSEKLLLAYAGIRDGQLVLVPVRVKVKEEKEAKARMELSEEEANKLAEEAAIDEETLKKLWGDEALQDSSGVYRDIGDLTRSVLIYLWPSGVKEFKDWWKLRGLDIEEGDEIQLRTLLMTRVFDRFSGRANREWFEETICDDLCDPNDLFGYRSFLRRFINDLREEILRQEKTKAITLPPEIDGQRTEELLSLMVGVAKAEGESQFRLQKVDFWEKIATLCSRLLETSESKRLLAKIKVKSKR